MSAASSAPQCRLCGARHWTREPHAVVNSGVVVNNAVVVNKPVGGRTVQIRCRDRHKKTPERAAYMREYMRTRRAKSGR